MRVLVLVGLLGLSSAAAAAERGFSVQDFDRMRVEGPYDVVVRTGVATSARAQGPQDELDRLIITANDGMLVIKPDRNAWGGNPSPKGTQRVVVSVTTRTLGTVILAGSGTVAIDRMRAPAVVANVAGSGDIKVGNVQADSVALSVAGSGSLAIAGVAKQARANIQGSGNVEAGGLKVQDAVVSVAGSGDLAISATRAAKVTTAGSGDVQITGGAACQVSRAGSGDVVCGHGV